MSISLPCIAHLHAQQCCQRADWKLLQTRSKGIRQCISRLCSPCNIGVHLVLMRNCVTRLAALCTSVHERRAHYVNFERSSGSGAGLEHELNENVSSWRSRAQRAWRRAATMAMTPLAPTMVTVTNTGPSSTWRMLSTGATFRTTKQSARKKKERQRSREGSRPPWSQGETYGESSGSTPMTPSPDSAPDLPARRGSNAVSRNISIVLENLLKDYESSQPPQQGNGRPTVVQTNMLIRSMGPVSELDMDYSMDCYFRQYWRDSRLSFRGNIQSLSLSIKMLERIWRPDTYFYNGKQSYVHTITVPNKLLRLSRDGDILYSMRLTIKAKCPMELQNFPMDRQSCPLILGSYAYSNKYVVYQWHNNGGSPVEFVAGMTLSQFDLMSSPQRNLTFKRRDGEFSILQVNFNLRRNTGYFLIQVYVPCILIVVLSWVSFWIHREATSDRVGLGITTVLTLSTISLDSRNDLPKVRYATALDWFLLMSFFYCIATLLQFAGVHYFTKVGSGEVYLEDDEWEDIQPMEEVVGLDMSQSPASLPVSTPLTHTPTTPSAAPFDALAPHQRSSFICPIYSDNTAECTRRGLEGGERLPVAANTRCSVHHIDNEMTSTWSSSSVQPDFATTPPATAIPRVERQTQTDRPKVPRWRQLLYCLAGDDKFRRERQRAAAAPPPGGQPRPVNSVSSIDRAARLLFPASFGLLNLFYWVVYVSYQEEFDWTNHPIVVDH